MAFRDVELNNSTNPSRSNAAWERERDKLKGLLYEGDSVLVRKIKRKGNKKHGYWYVAYIRDYKFPKTNFMCNIEIAIRTKEVIIE